MKRDIFETLHITWADAERGRGPTGTAIRTGKPSACRNILTDAAFAPWRDEAIKRGYASSIVLPIMAGTKAFAALTIYSREPESFSDDEARILADLAADIAHGITSFRMYSAQAKAEEALRESDRRLSLAQKVGRVGVFDGEFKTDKFFWSEELKSIYNVPPEFEATYSAWLGFVHPDDVTWVTNTMKRALHARKHEVELDYRIVRTDKEVRWLEDRAVVSYDPSGSPMRLIGTTIDISVKKRAEEKLRDFERGHRKSAFRLISTLALSIFVAEFIVMVLLSIINPISLILEAVLDGLMMLTLISPTLYRFVFRPLLRSITEREQVEESLRQSHNELEFRVRERTASLAISNKKLAEEIAERKRTENALRESEERLNRAQEISHLGSWEFDLDQNTLSWSKEVYRMFGMEANMIGPSYEAFLETVHPYDREAVDAAYTNSIREGRNSYEIEHRIVRKSSGEIRTVHEKCDHLRDGSGRIVRSIGMVQDITERKAAEQRLLILSKAVDSAANGIAITDREGSITWVNPAFTNLTGYTLEEVLGRNPRLLKSGKHSNAFYTDLWETIVSGKPWHGELTNRRKDGVFYTDEMTITPVRDWSGEITHFIAIKEDITPRKVAENETLRRLNSFRLISRAATHLLKETNKEHVFQYIADTLSECLRDGVVVVNEFDPARHCIVVRALSGDGNDLRLLSGMLGGSLTGMALRFDPSVRARMNPGVLTKVDGGLYDLSFRTLPERLCLDVQKQLGLGDQFVMAFSLEEDLLGTVALLTRGRGLPENAGVIEALVNQAAIALKRLRTEEERNRSLIDAQRERSRAESLAREVNAERNVLDAIMENTQAQLAYLDPEFNFVMANSAYARAVDTQVGELIGQNYFALFPNADERKIFEHVRTMGVPSVVIAKPVVTPGPPGQAVTYWDWTLVPVKNDSGQLQGLAISQVDITEHFREREEISRNAEEYRLLMEEASDGILLTNMEGEIFAANKRLCELIGSNKEELSNLRVFDLLSEEDLSRLRVHLNDIKAGMQVSAEHHLRRTDGLVIDVETKAKMLANGRIQVIVRDITKEKERRRRLMRVMKEEVFDKLFLKVRAFKHGQSHVMTLNRLAFLMKNLDAIPRSRQAPESDMPADHDEPMARDLLFSRFAVAVQEYMNTVAPELETIASLVVISGIDAARPNPSANVSTGTDLAALVDHLRQKLGSIMGLDKDPPADSIDLSYPPLRSEALNIIGRIKYMVSDITVFIENTFATDVSASVKSALLRFEPQHVNAQIDTSSVQEECRVIFNGVELSEVLAVLIQNAFDAFIGDQSAGRAQQHTVRIRTEDNNGHVKIIVEDDGPGVPNDLRDRIFENGVSGKSGSRGFGLSYARTCVAKYGGRIALDSTSEQGAKFVIEVSRL